MTYGDGVGDIDIRKLVDFHRNHGKKATVTAATAPGRFGAYVPLGPRWMVFRKNRGRWRMD